MASGFGTANLDNEDPCYALDGGAPSLTGARKIPRQGSAGGGGRKIVPVRATGPNAACNTRRAFGNDRRRRGKNRSSAAPVGATRHLAEACDKREPLDSAALPSTVRNSAPVSHSLAMSSSERTNSSVSAKDRRVIELCRATVTSLTRSPSGTSCCCIALVRSISAASRSRTNALSLVEYSPSRRRLKRSLSNACQAPDMSSKDGLPETS